MNIQLSDHFTYKRLFRFTIPSIFMMIFTSIYSIVDGIFTSNFAGKEAFAGLNLIMPGIMLFSGLGFMIGSGGSALVARFLGEKNKRRANEVFSFLIYATIVAGILLSIAGWFVIPSFARILGAEGELLRYSVIYARTLCPALTSFMLQSVFQAFFIAAEKPHLGLRLTLVAGCTNMILDALFVGLFKWGIVGAALATDIANSIGGLVPLVYFFAKKDSVLHLGKAKWEGKALLKTLSNGSSELLNSISSSIVGMLYNAQLLKYAGVDGVAAYGVIMYVGFVFAAIFIGYSMGVAPVVSYNYGAENSGELKNLFKKSLTVIFVTSLVMLIASEFSAGILASVFTGYDKELFSLTKSAFRIYSLGFLLCGTNIFGSSFFTALNNGIVSAFLSVLRTLVFQVSFILLLPVLLGTAGIWLASPGAELFCLVMTAGCFFGFRKKYNY
ncbi:MAG: MATE family efflux transporter [Treponema sp.]|nr:MATE family efflux transporter [Treponema sp.]